MNEMGNSCCQIYDLELVLLRKKDSATQICYLDEIVKDLEEQPVTLFWKRISVSLVREIALASRSTN
jgi:hypothetical protein